MKKYGFAYALVFAFISVSAWGWGGSDGGSIVPRGISPDDALREYAAGQMQQMMGDGDDEIDAVEAPDIDGFQQALEDGVNGMGQVGVFELLALARYYHVEDSVRSVLEALDSLNEASVDYSLFWGYFA